ncbi:gp53-like domain-containing protein [Sphingomonas sp. Leaf25]|uniref:gp53-like domain-containing protein n=1 Tax=Sphingomonas sp. Leaf25 TaxID=1735692 RepID=UPI0006F1E240|nr:hypothetical protein [Sphingomonas sp. Leaf25]KQN00578.1 hypothetical protein ASE78_05695 [Sphingomonas sp. Leaf25]
MQRIDGPTRSADLPAPAPVGTGNSAPGYFQQGDPATGRAPTTLDVDWANGVQEEICNVIEHAGLPLDKADRAQLRKAIVAIITEMTSAEDATSQLGPTGYRISPDGYIEQWGYVPGSVNGEGSRQIVFPIPFPVECFGVSGTVLNTGSSTSGAHNVQEVAVSQTGATIFLQSDQNSSGVQGGFRWRATGR